MSTQYGKTENLFTRNDETKKLNIGDFRSGYVRQIKDWLITEKIDGTNMRIILDWAMDIDEEAWRPVVDVRGRSDNANMPPNFLQEAFGIEAEHELTGRVLHALRTVIGGGLNDTDWEAHIQKNPTMMVVYGEGYGAGIQSGGHYSPTKQFRAFDVVTYRYADISIPGERTAYAPEYNRPFWRMWDEVCDVADVIGIKTAPMLASTAELSEIVDRVPILRSAVAAEDSGVEYTDANDLPFAEGIVARTDPYLYDHNHGRVFFKLKRKDL